MKRWACIFRAGGVGDNLVAGSVLRPLKRMGYMTEMMTSGHASDVFLNNPFIDKLTVKQDGEIPGGAEWHKWFASIMGGYDIFINLSHTMETLHAVRSGESAFWWPPAYRRKRCGGSYLETAHDIVGVPHEFGPLFFPTDEERERAALDKVKQFGARYILWVLGGTRIDKTHPYATHTIARLIKELDTTVVMMGHGNQQWEYANAVQTEVRRTNSTDDGLVLALTPPDQIAKIEEGGPRHWGLRRSLATALAADVVVTPDSGIGWAVAMEPMPKVALISHASVENITTHWVNTVSLHADPNRVPCWPCHCLHDTIDTCVRATHVGQATAAACISDIPVEDIVEAIARAIKPGNVVRLEAAE